MMSLQNKDFDEVSVNENLQQPEHERNDISSTWIQEKTNEMYNEGYNFTASEVQYLKPTL